MKIRSIVALAGLALLSAPSAFAASENDGLAVDAIALYSRGSAVVQDSRSFNLQRGEQRVSWPIPGALQPDTFWLSGDDVRLNGFSVGQAGGSSAGMLAGRIGQSVTITDDRGKMRQGTLVDVEGDTAYVRVDHRIERITAASSAELSWPADANNNAGVSITLDVNAEHAGKQTLTATYQTDAPSWQTSYTGRFDSKRGQLTLTSAAIIDNSGHAALDADQAWLVAGHPARAGGGGPRPVMFAKMRAADSSSAGPAQPVGDVYRYPLSNGLHVAAGQTRSIALMKPLKVVAKRRYSVENQAGRDSGKARQHAQVSLSFTNKSRQPLPAGPVRVYDAGHAAQLMGAANIQDTPVGAPVRLRLGESFDVTATHRVTGQQRTGNGSQNTQVTVELFNAGDQAKPVTVTERLPGNAQLADGAPKPSGGSANQPEWRIKVPANGHKSLTYSFTRPVS